MLAYEPLKRLSAFEASLHPFITSDSVASHPHPALPASSSTPLAVDAVTSTSIKVNVEVPRTPEEADKKISSHEKSNDKKERSKKKSHSRIRLLFLLISSLFYPLLFISYLICALCYGVHNNVYF